MFSLTKVIAAVGFVATSAVAFTGDLTYYSPGLGACGITNNDGDYIAAASHILYDSFPGYAGGNPNNNPVCGRSLTATCSSFTVSVYPSHVS